VKSKSSYKQFEIGEGRWLRYTEETEELKTEPRKSTNASLQRV
jgi:hypothetical protein